MKTPAKKMSAKKPTAKKPTAKKPTAKKSPAKKTPAKKAPAKKSPAKKAPASAAVGARVDQDVIVARFAAIGGWRGATLARMRALILEADAALTEERKWIKPSNPFGVLAYSRAGLVLTLEVYQSVVKVTFAYGSKVPDPTGIFNASLLGLRRAIDIPEGGSVDAGAFKALVRGAVAVNVAKKAG